MVLKRERSAQAWRAAIETGHFQAAVQVFTVGHEVFLNLIMPCSYCTCTDLGAMGGI